MIVNFSVQNFGAIKDKVTLSFEATKSKDLEDFYIIKTGKYRLLKLGLIYGANASGKTTILNALDFVRNIALNPLEKKTETFDFKPFLFDENTPQENTFFELEFVQNEIKYLYEIELNKNAIVHEKLYFFKPNKALVFERKTDENKKLTSIKFGSKIKIKEEYKTVLEGNTLWNNTVLGGYLKTNFEAKELQNVIDWFQDKLNLSAYSKTALKQYIAHKLDENELQLNVILQFVQKADLKITNINIREKKEKEASVRGSTFQQDIVMFQYRVITNLVKEMEKSINKNEITFQHTIKKDGEIQHFELSYEDESEGTQKYFQFGGLLDLMIRHSIIFPFDEIESSLHPDLLKHFLMSFLVNAKNSQLITTTHHRELLMEKDIFRDDVIWFTEKQADGSTDLFSLADFDSSVVRDTSSIYNAYKIGKLGATPNLNDYYLDLEEDGSEN